MSLVAWWGSQTALGFFSIPFGMVLRTVQTALSDLRPSQKRGPFAGLPDRQGGNFTLGTPFSPRDLSGLIYNIQCFQSNRGIY